ncbi:MAG TPA: hypothetical protein VFN23_13145 [Ktedonobacteraceae bacterium]|nr:hypothetical protein [Ktedonobacteraceae bacterium]
MAKEKKYQAPLPPNTLRNADGSPYSAGHDEKSLGQVAYEAFSQDKAYKYLVKRQLGYDVEPLLWNALSSSEQKIWEHVAEAVLKQK